MVARELTKHCFHRILRCLCSFAVDAQLLNRCLASTYKYYAKGLHSAHDALAKPTYAPGSSSPIANHFISHKDTSASSRATTPLQKLITKLYFLKGTLQRTFGQKLSYIMSREEYPIGFTPRVRRPTSSGTLHYRPVPSLSPILCL
jgi:hypothetical protein